MPSNKPKTFGEWLWHVCCQPVADEEETEVTIEPMAYTQASFAALTALCFEEERRRQLVETKQLWQHFMTNPGSLDRAIQEKRRGRQQTSVRAPLAAAQWSPANSYVQPAVQRAPVYATHAAQWTPQGSLANSLVFSARNA